MIVDMRTYTCKPGTVKKHIALYEQHGLHVQKRHLGEPLAYLLTDIGDVNSYVHMWVYDDLADRSRKRAAMIADPEWQAFSRLAAEADYLVGQHNCIMSPAVFAPLKR